MAFTTPCTLLLLALLQTPAPTAVGRWDDVELPRGFLLDLETGLVTNREADGRPALRYQAGQLLCTHALRLLPEAEPGEGRDRFEREAGQLTEALIPAVGQELCFDLGAAGWGYLRVLSASDDRVALEYALAEEGAQALERLPATLETRSLAGGVELRWPAREDTEYLLERRVVAGTQDVELESFVRLAEDARPPFVDPDGQPGRIYEYRVSRAGGAGGGGGASAAGGIGARARGATDILPPDVGITIVRGQSVDLLTGRSHVGRVDLTVEFVGNNGAHFGCGPGVRIRLLSDMERERWELESDRGDPYRDQRVFINADRELGCVLPEGVYARLRVETAPGGATLIYRQIDIAGGRTFPPPPPRPMARWDADPGVTFAGLPRSPLGEDTQLDLALEREEEYLSGEWHEIMRPDPDQHVLVDATGARRGLLRYRYRIHYGDDPQSIPGPPAVVLLGDDGGPESDALLQSAIGDLASPDFESRLRAQGVLSALGSRAWPSLRELLGAEDPELAAAARDLLAGSKDRPTDEFPVAESMPSVETAPVLLGAGADAKGLGEPPPGLLSADSDRRALALLRAWKTLERDAFEPWRELLAVADPDPGIRLVASVVGAWPPLSFGPQFELRPGFDAAPPPFDLGSFALELYDLREATEDVLSRLDPGEPWSALARLELLHEMRGAEDARAALEIAALGESLIARHGRESEGDVFLSAALELVQDPGSRLRAAANLADLRLGRITGPPGGEDGLMRRIVRLPEADTQVLVDELESLRLSEAQDVDIVLPPGVYESLERQPTVTIGGKGLRLIGEGRVVLRTGLMIYRNADVVLEKLVLAPESGSAVNVDRAAVLLRDCYIDAPALALQANDGVLELSRTEIVPRERQNRIAGGIRVNGFSMVSARDCRIACESSAISGARWVYLEGCVVDGGERAAVEGRADGDVLIVDSYLRAHSGAIMGGYHGILEGVIVSSYEAATRIKKTHLVICPVHTAQSGPAGEFERAERAPSCPLGR